MSVAIGRRTRSFPKLYVAMIRAGEAGGILDDVLDHVSLPEPNSTDGPERIKLLAARDPGIAVEERLELALAIAELGDRERTIVVGTFGAGLTQMELGERVGLSQSHVSKLLARALSKIGRRVAWRRGRFAKAERRRLPPRCRSPRRILR